MKLFPSLVLVLLVGCQTEEKTAQKQPVAVTRTDAPYTEDFKRLCDSMSLSGADKMEKLERVAPHGKWLAENLTTKEAQMFLVNLKQLPKAQQGDALEAEAKRLGLPGCALAAEFR